MSRVRRVEPPSLDVLWFDVQGKEVRRQSAPFSYARSSVRYGQRSSAQISTSLVIGVVTSLCVSMTIARRWICSARCQSRSRYASARVWVLRLRSRQTR